MLPHGDGSFTMEELLRAIWRRDKKRFRKMAERRKIYGILIPQFEREDAERLAALKEGNQQMRQRR